MKSIKLFLVAPGFYPTHGGAELRFLRYLPLLREFGVNTEVVTGTPKSKKFSPSDFDADWRSLPDGTHLPEAVIDGTPIHRIKLPEKGASKRSRILLSEVIRRCSEGQSGRPDVIQLLSPLPLSSASLLKTIKSLGIPLVFAYSIAHTFSSWSLMRYVQRAKVRKLYRNLDCVFAASTVLEQIIHSIDPRLPVKVIANGVDAEKFRPVRSVSEKRALRSALQLPEDAVVITLVGSVHPRKGTHLLIEAWAAMVDRNPNIHVVVVGPKPNINEVQYTNFEKTIEQLVQNSSFAHQVHFVGSKDNVDEYLRASDVFVFPSEKEGMPNAVLEAMATSLPVVLTPFVGLSEDFGKAGKEYLLAARNVSAIEHEIQTLLDDQELRERLGRDARAWILQKMNLRQCVAVYAQVYRSLAGLCDLETGSVKGR